jgi:hypothetical protein
MNITLNTQEQMNWDLALDKMKEVDDFLAWVARSLAERGELRAATAIEEEMTKHYFPFLKALKRVKENNEGATS